MGLFDIGEDWSEVEAPAFEEIPAGVYEAELTSIDTWTAKDSEKKAFVFEYLITADEAHDDKYVGRSKKEFKFYTDDSGVIEKDGLGYVKARLINLGVPEDANISSIDTDDLIGTPVAVTIVERKGTGSRAGETFFNVTRVQRLGGDDVSVNKAAGTKTGTEQPKKEEADEDNPFA